MPDAANPNPAVISEPCPHRRVSEKMAQITQDRTPNGMRARCITQRAMCLDCGYMLERRTPPVAFGPWRMTQGQPAREGRPVCRRRAG